MADAKALREIHPLSLAPPGLVEAITSTFALCVACGGDGVQDVDCSPCSGTGRTAGVECGPCKGDGGHVLPCGPCEGKGFLPRAPADPAPGGPRG